MTAYAFLMTLLVGMFAGTFITVTVALQMEKQKLAKMKATVMHPAEGREFKPTILNYHD